jgi:hypothetical protein
VTRTSCNTIGVRHTHTSKYVTWCEVKLLHCSCERPCFDFLCVRTDAHSFTHSRSHIHVHTIVSWTRDELLLRRTRDAAG